jgi:hypothetical protein
MLVVRSSGKYQGAILMCSSKEERELATLLCEPLTSGIQLSQYLLISGVHDIALTVQLHHAGHQIGSPQLNKEDQAIVAVCLILHDMALLKKDNDYSQPHANPHKYRGSDAGKRLTLIKTMQALALAVPVSHHDHPLHPAPYPALEDA